MEGIRFTRPDKAGYTQIYHNGRLTYYVIKKNFVTGSYDVRYHGHSLGCIFGFYKRAKEYAIKVILNGK